MPPPPSPAARIPEYGTAYRRNPSFPHPMKTYIPSHFAPFARPFTLSFLSPTHLPSARISALPTFTSNVPQTHLRFF
jgi:hypothetical protein